jgi:hypothetical protein
MDRRQERGRSDERQDKRDCCQEEGRVGDDKRECKQEEVRDGVKGNQGDKGEGEKDKDDKDQGSSYASSQPTAAIISWSRTPP